ncbi:hypothetical protein ONZ45_g9669 [Pleurotus djamor]|nr:hypothetical protein ONZ45_g9669 [Pleurotus djamor]
MSTPDPNYASLFGIHTVAGAIVFAVVYAPCVAFFAYKSVRSPTYVLIILTLFCAIREAAFIIRALLASSDTFGTNLMKKLTSGTRELLSNAPLPQGPIARITRNKMMFRFTLTAGVVLGIVGATMGTSVDSSSDDRNRGHSLRIAGAVIFLVLTVLQAYRTLLFTKAEHLGEDLHLKLLSPAHASTSNSLHQSPVKGPCNPRELGAPSNFAVAPDTTRLLDGSNYTPKCPIQ